MNFLSLEFLVIVLGSLVVYGLFPRPWRWGVLLAASYIFYAFWNWQYLWVLVVITLSTFWVSHRMALQEDDRRRKFWLMFGLAVTVGFLAAFKYYDYLIHAINSFLTRELRLPLIDQVAPIGIAFFSLQVIAYLVDVYRGRQNPAKHLGHYALFIAFFPQQIAGPITRAQKLLPQFQHLQTIQLETLRAGFHRVLLGFLQKFVIADRLAEFTSPIFADHTAYSSLLLLANLFIYAIQIYSDFAGYSNIVIGIAKMFGVDLAENFRQPYLALEIADFWNRWHISLSNWLRDYIFYPTMRFLRKRMKNNRSWVLIWVPPLVTMLVSGLWHGTGPKFVLWGLLHGVMLSLSVTTSRWRKRIKKRLGKVKWLFTFTEWLVTFIFLVFSWVFFRLPGIGSGLAYLRQIAVFSTSGGFVEPEIVGVAIAVLMLFLVLEALIYFEFTLERLLELPLVVRWGVYYLLILLVMFMGNFTTSQPFIYQQF